MAIAGMSRRGRAQYASPARAKQVHEPSTQRTHKLSFALRTASTGAIVADAELIVYGATEPDATVYVDGEPIVLNSDGTFRFQMSFQDGQLKFPIVAVAVDGEQNRSVQMDFERTTSNRRTNTKAEAVEEWFARS